MSEHKPHIQAASPSAQPPRWSLTWVFVALVILTLAMVAIARSVDGPGVHVLQENPEIRAERAP